MPQIHGASRNAWLHLKETLVVEINSVTDNPIILDNGESVSGGHFHGQPIALPIDYATLAASELGNVADRRLYLLLNGDGGDLPKFLIKSSGLNSGFMILQYTTAALASENKTLCMPASADSIPTSLGQEDHVSMGSIAARKFNRVLDNLEQIVAIELLSASQALDFRRPLKSSPFIESVHTLVRSVVQHAAHDRIFADDIQKVHRLVANGQVWELVAKLIKPLELSLDEASWVRFNS
jgi:histidine ammonia-lyase